MSTQNWPNNWPPLSDLIMTLRSRPAGCRRGDFADIDAKRPRGQIAILGMGWISIRRRLLAEGYATLHDGKLFFAHPSATPEPEGANSLDLLPEAELDALADYLRNRAALSVEDRKRIFALVSNARIYSPVSTPPIQPAAEVETSDELPE